MRERETHLVVEQAQRQPRAVVPDALVAAQARADGRRRDGMRARPGVERQVALVALGRDEHEGQRERVGAVDCCRCRLVGVGRGELESRERVGENGRDGEDALRVGRRRRRRERRDELLERVVPLGLVLALGEQLALDPPRRKVRLDAVAQRVD